MHKAPCVTDSRNRIYCGDQPDITNIYTVRDQSLLLTMLGIKINDWNGERIEKSCRV
jgi:hypothetical protein